MSDGFLSEVVPEIRRQLDSPVYDSAPRSDHRPARSFRHAIEKDGATGALVLEFKRASPGRADPRLPTRSVAEFVAATKAASPSAYSCLATAPRFFGSASDVRELASRTDRPVLFKDFVIDRRQVQAAANAAASAILLIARLEGTGLLSEPLSRLADAAHHQGLEVVLEFHDRTELSRTADVAADVYGVNARDLDTLRVKPHVAVDTLSEAARRGLRPLLGLSGIEHASDAERFWAAGADGILVGTALARSDDPAAFATGLRRRGRGGVA